MVKKKSRSIHPRPVALIVAVLVFGQAAALLRADDTLISEARRERGTVRWYTALNVNGSKPLADAFERDGQILSRGVLCRGRRGGRFGVLRRGRRSNQRRR